MDAEELAAELRKQYDNASRNESACQIHLFGIRYARELQSCGVPLKRILELSGVSMGYLSEVSKGIKLARYVRLREPEEMEEDSRP